MSIHGWFPLRLTGLFSLLSKGHSKVFSSTWIQMDQFLQHSDTPIQYSHPYMTTGKTIALTIWISVSKVMCLLLNTLSRFLFKKQVSSNFMVAVNIHSDLESKKRKFITVPTFCPSICMKWWKQMAWFSFSGMLSQLFRSPLKTSSKGSLVSLPFLLLECYHLNIWICWYFSLQSWLSVQLLSHVQLFVAQWIAARQTSLSITISRRSLNSGPSSWWCHPGISSSVILFSSCPKSLPASESFPMSQLFAWGGQSTGVSALASFLPKNTQGWSP